MQATQATFRTKKRKIPKFEKLMALLATLNYGFVLFDISYVTLRDFYWQYWPTITQIYDPFKGIEPHRETEKYLETVQRLNQQIAKTGIQSPQTNVLIEDLRNQSINMIDEDPFAIANKSGTLEKIKNRMRDHLPNPEDSSKEAFRTFWNQDYLLQKGFNQEMTWFEAEISPLIAKNYYRSLAETGGFISYFWRIDLPFILIFGLEFLARTYLISRRYVSVTWLDAMFWRWYDIFLLLPFWRLLRIIPVSIRLQQAGFLDTERLRGQASRGFVASFAQELTEAVIVQFINQLQGEIEKGDVIKRFFQSQKKRYLDINEINEIEALTTRFAKLAVYKVIPQLQSDIEAILRHNIENIIKQSSFFQPLQNIPGLQQLPNRITEQLVTELTKLITQMPQQAYESIKAGMEDPVGTQLSNQLIQDFNQIISREIQQEQSMTEIKSLLIDFLEEFKINYVQQIDENNFDQVLANLQKQRQIEGKKRW